MEKNVCIISNSCISDMAFSFD